MDKLPPELVLLIFNSIELITDKRQFLKTCKNYNMITKESMKNYEDNYTVKGFNMSRIHSVYKFTLELCHDKYFDKIPTSYINPKNPVLIEALVTFNCQSLFNVAKENNCNLINVCYFAAKNGNLDILKWVMKMVIY